MITWRYSGIKDYTVATCKYMLGEARSKFVTIAGPQGGGQLNGDTPKNEVAQEMEKLEQEVLTAVTYGMGYGFTQAKSHSDNPNIIVYNYMIN